MNSLKSGWDLVLVNIISAMLIVVISFFSDSPARIILGLPFILLFPGYMLICALFPSRKDLELVERLMLSMGLSIAVTSLMGLALNYTYFGITLYSVTVSLFLFMLLMSAVAAYRRRAFLPEQVYAPLSLMNISEGFEWIKCNFIKSRKEDRITKILAIIAFIFIISVLAIIAKTPPVSGYELSIYDAYPWPFWMFICISISCGIIILIHQAVSEQEQKSNWWLIGLCIVILSNAIFLGLPFFRGYYIYPTGDALSHLGWMKDIITTGHI
ncbi:putative membrane protein [Candidatus Methanophagaceae archaeon]|nr:putative membrane protein [Methanophagales archaeon]